MHQVFYQVDEVELICVPLSVIPDLIRNLPISFSNPFLPCISCLSLDSFLTRGSGDENTSLNDEENSVLSR